MENNSYYNNQPKSIQLEESANNNTQNNNFSNENNINNIDNLNNFFENVSNVSNENFNLFMDIFNNDKISHLNETCNNLSVYEDDKINLINDLNNNLNDDLMLGKKSNKNEKSVFNFNYNHLSRKLNEFLCAIKKELQKLKDQKLKDPVKIKSLETSINVFENIRNKLKNLKKNRKNKNKNQNKNQNIDKINENEINNVNNLNIEFKSKQKDVLNKFGAKKAKQNGESCKKNYPKCNEENAKILSYNCKYVSRTRGKFQKIYDVITDNNSIYKNLLNLFDNLKNFNIKLKEKMDNCFKSIKDNPQGNNEIEESYMKYYYNKLLTTFQVSRGFKEFFDKVKCNDFLNKLYNKHKSRLENKNLIEKILEDANSNKTIPPKYSDTEICKNIMNFRNILARYGIKSNNTPFEIKTMLDFIPFMYNIFCLLGYVNEIGEITNDDAKKDMETVMKTVMDKIEDTINLYINYLNKNKNTKIKFEITENNNFNINFNLYDLNQPKEQEEQKEQEKLEESVESRSQNNNFFDNTY